MNTFSKRHTLRSRKLAACAASAIVALGLVLAGCGSQGSGSPSNGVAGSNSATGKPLDAAAYDALISAGSVADSATVDANTWASAVKKAGVLKVGGTKTSALFSLQSTDDNKLRGFDAGLSQLLARYIIGDAKTDVSVVDSSTREAVLQNGTVNAVFATYSITDERKQKIDFAGPYYVSRQGILVKSTNDDIKSVKDLDGKKVGVQAGSTGPQIVKDAAPNATVQEFQDDSQLVQAIKQGRIDAYVVDQSLVLGDVAKEPKALKVVGDGFGSEDPYGIGLPKGSDATAFVNAWLKKIEDDGTWAKLWKLTIGDRTGVTEVPTPPAVGK
ncbi:glutamate ABC transporter substrate-binding protein [Bifidobacterium sp.]|jgi:glutamate transport system substrate-binding protein|uniref:glutamate ABC transporter substrate-binding protein n=1 Tax=Bifidobacterium sp. TaxID=41200 RepID=UPI0025BC0B4E|nr:glutamate ABC transporter substrate-binding protein [Bifidobacterium sp.]MCH4209911.1 glutamate ABC transporter substrate-binding protein [Bifidobacterium sp.]MCI1224868.1 glutamate ABC transporter substrate-binding protein [Bifidobacterium sp.]